MRIHVTLTAALLAVAGVAFAEPAKSPPAAAAQPQQAPPVILASADLRPGIATATQASPAPVKRRIGRVTTCRCGDPQPDPEQQDQ